MAEQKFKRRKFLVDPDLQIGLSAEMVGWVFAYFALFSIAAQLPDVVTLLSSDADSAAHLAAADELRAFARIVVLPMGVTFVAMAVHGVFLTHRIAGPMVRFKRTVRELAARRLPGPIALRGKDHFKDLADEMNVAVSVLREDAVRRKRMSSATVTAIRRLIESIESRSADRRETLALAHAALDDAETLAHHLDSMRGTDDADSQPVPLPEADLPAVVSAEIDELEADSATADPAAVAATAASSRAAPAPAAVK